MTEEIEFKSEHNLDFEIAPFMDPEWTKFRIGTCEGLWACDDKFYKILAVVNNEKGNGHLNDVFEWFENSCKRDGRDLKVLEVWNKKFKQHLISKRGFKPSGIDDVIKKIRL